MLHLKKQYRKPTLVILVGNLASGKSTVARKLHEQDYYVVSLDGFRYALGGGTYVFHPAIEQDFYQPEEFFLKWLMKKKVDVVIDDAKNVNSSFRKRFIDIAKKNKYNIISIELPQYSKKTSVNARMRNPHGYYSRSVWEKTYDKFLMMQDEVLLQEGINGIIRFKDREEINEFNWGSFK